MLGDQTWEWKEKSQLVWEKVNFKFNPVVDINLDKMNEFIHDQDTIYELHLHDEKLGYKLSQRMLI